MRKINCVKKKEKENHYNGKTRPKRKKMQVLKSNK